MKIRSGTIGKGTLPVLAAAFLCTGTQAQIQVGGYTCSASFIRTNNSSLSIAVTNATCTLPVEMAQWFDLSADAELSGSYVTLKCVDFSMWGTANVADQLISVRVFQDLTPLSSDGGPGSCDDDVPGYDGANEPGPDLASALLLGEEETFIPIGVNPPSGPRPDGDFSVEFSGSQGGGILLEPNIAFFVVIAHAGEAVTQFGANSSGEAGDSTTGAPGGVTGGPEQTWVRPFNCTVGGGACSQTGDWQKSVLYYPGNIDVVMQLHLDLGDTRDPPQLRFNCRQDIAPIDLNEFGVVINIGDGEVNVVDLLALLGSWGQVAPPRPQGDIAPCPTPGVDCFGDNEVNVLDLLTLLAAWGACPNLVKDCSTTLDPGNLVGQVNEGTFPWSIEVGLLEAATNRPSTNDLSAVLAGGVGICGWANYSEAGGPRNGTGTGDLGTVWGDAFGIFMGNLNDGPVGPIFPSAIVVGGDVWFQYTADCNGRAFISATSNCGTGEVVDTILEVYPGEACPTSWTEVLSCDDSSLDPAGCGDFGEVDFVVLQGDQFLIRIAGWFGETGSGDLNISCVDNSACSAALPVLVNGASVSANTLNAGIGTDAPNCPTTQDVGGRWFSVIGDGNTLTASTCQTEAVELAGGQLNLFDSILSVYCGTAGEVCADLTCVASSNADTCNLHQEVSWCTTFGQEYWILVHGNDTVSGPPFFSEGFFILDVTTDATSCATALACGVPRPFNDLCANADVLIPGPFVDVDPDPLVITLVSVVNTPLGPDTPAPSPRHNNFNALTDGPSPAPGCTFINRDVWYRYTPNFTSSVVVDTCRTDGDNAVTFDTAIEIYLAAEAECPPVDSTGFIECQNGSAGCPGGSQFTTPVIVFAGQEILIRLGSNGGTKEGFFTLTVTATALESACAETPVPEDFCPDGGVLEGGGLGEPLIADGGADTTNGGCNMCAPGQLFDTIVPDRFDDLAPVDVVICGQISTYVADADLDCDGFLDGFAFELRDTDWYELVIPEFINPDFGGFTMRGAEVTITFASEFSASFGITEAVCGATPGDVVPFLVSGINGGLCTESELTAFLDTGTYYVVVTAFSLSGIAVGGTHEGHDYVLTMAPLEEGLFFALNDECEGAFVVTSNSSTQADNRDATEAASDATTCETDPFFAPGGGRGTQSSFGTIWYVFEATTPTALVTTVNTPPGPNAPDNVTNSDNNMVIWQAGAIIPCDLGVEVGCAEDTVAFLAEVNLSGLIVGEDYYIMMGAWWINTQSVYQLDIISPDPGP